MKNLNKLILLIIFLFILVFVANFKFQGERIESISMEELKNITINSFYIQNYSYILNSSKYILNIQYISNFDGYLIYKDKDLVKRLEFSDGNKNISLEFENLCNYDNITLYIKDKECRLIKKVNLKLNLNYKIKDFSIVVSCSKSFCKITKMQMRIDTNNPIIISKIGFLINKELYDVLIDRVFDKNGIYIMDIGLNIPRNSEIDKVLIYDDCKKIAEKEIKIKT